MHHSIFHLTAEATVLHPIIIILFFLEQRGGGLMLTVPPTYVVTYLQALEESFDQQR